MSSIEDVFAAKIIEIKKEISKMQTKYDSLLKSTIDIKRNNIQSTMSTDRSNTVRSSTRSNGLQSKNAKIEVKKVHLDNKCKNYGDALKETISDNNRNNQLF